MQIGSSKLWFYKWSTGCPYNLKAVGEIGVWKQNVNTD